MKCTYRGEGLDMFMILWSFWKDRHVAIFSKAIDENAHFELCCSASQCDFETGSCGWYDLTPGDGFDWIRGSSAEVSPHFYIQPPPVDHSTNSSEGKFTHTEDFTVYRLPM